MSRSTDYYLIAKQIETIFGDTFNENDLEAVRTTYKQVITEAEVDEDEKDHSLKICDSIDFQINKDIKCIGYVQDLSEFMHPHFADGSSRYDHASSYITTIWQIMGKK